MSVGAWAQFCVREGPEVYVEKKLIVADDDPGKIRSVTVTETTKEPNKSGNVDSASSIPTDREEFVIVRKL
jgi:hypothetical protein